MFCAMPAFSIITGRCNLMFLVSDYSFSSPNIRDSRARVVTVMVRDTRKLVFRGLGPDPTQTGLYSYRRWLEAGDFGFRKIRNCSVNVAKTKALSSFTVTVKLICTFVFAIQIVQSLFS